MLLPDDDDDVDDYAGVDVDNDTSAETLILDEGN
jgi:hypothetical protein